MSGTSFLVVGGGGVAASAAASAALNASTSARATAISQHFWRAVANDPHLGPVATVVVLGTVIAVVAVLLKTVFTLWTTR